MNADSLKVLLRSKLNAFNLTEEEFDQLLLDRGEQIFVDLIEQYGQTLTDSELEQFIILLEGGDYNLINDYIISHGDISKVEFKNNNINNYDRSN